MASIEQILARRQDIQNKYTVALMCYSFCKGLLRIDPNVNISKHIELFMKEFDVLEDDYPMKYLMSEYFRIQKNHYTKAGDEAED